MNREKPQDLGPALAALARVVDIVEMHPVGFLARLMRNAPAPGSTIDINVKPMVAHTINGPREFMVRGDFSVSAQAEEPTAEEFLKIRYAIIARYSIPEGIELRPEVVELFSQTNAMVHFWPYLRAFVTTSSAQLGVPPLTIPPWRVTSTLQTESHSSEPTLPRGT